MAAPINQTEDQREEQLANVARLYLLGKTQYEVAAEVGISQGQVCYDLKIIRQRWLDSSLQDFNELKAKELAKIDMVESEFLKAWDRSQGLDREGRARDGDPRFMDGVLKCIAKRCEIFGFDVAKKVAFVNPDGTPAYGPFLTEDERRNRLLAAFLEQGAAGESGSAVM